VPGGYIYITQGLLFRLNNEAQLAGVLGHEAGHIAHRHSAQQIQQAQGLQIGAVVAGIFGGSAVGDLSGLVGSLYLMKYGRGQEKEADMSGLKYMTDGGYAPQGMVQTMEILKKASGGKGPPEFLSTHPDPGNRVEYLTETIQEKYMRAAESGRFGDKEFKQNVLDRKQHADIPATPDELAHVSWCATCRER
jgi:predicted Zn-dependent protease